MSKILKFPERSEEVRTTALTGQLRERMLTLDEVYQKLDAAHEVLNTLESIANNQEKLFDECLKEYAALVGAGNLEAEMLGYSQNVKIVAVSETGEFKVEYNGEDEDV